MLKLVNAVLAQDGGALSNLMEVYETARKDTQNQWIFITSVVKLDSTDHIRVLSFPILKKSWLFRLAFDFGYYEKLLNQYRPDIIYNYSFYRRSSKCRGTYYYYATNALFFTEVSFSLKESKSLWARQKLLKPLAFKSIRDADVVVVESVWMKTRIIESLHIDPSRIVVKKHQVTGFSGGGRESAAENSSFFFYPTSAYIYKNIDVVVDAAVSLKEQGLCPAIVLTLRGDENDHVKALKEKAEDRDLNIDWVGTLDKQQMEKAYNHSVLLFPSYLETVGLPLLEAAYLNRPIICADLEYAKCALDGYKNVVFFRHDDPIALSVKMREAMQSQKERDYI